MDFYSANSTYRTIANNEIGNILRQSTCKLHCFQCTLSRKPGTVKNDKNRPPFSSFLESKKMATSKKKQISRKKIDPAINVSPSDSIVDETILDYVITINTSKFPSFKFRCNLKFSVNYLLIFQRKKVMYGNILVIYLTQLAIKLIRVTTFATFA